jgi:hypothetical protein
MGRRYTWELMVDGSEATDQLAECEGKCHWNYARYGNGWATQAIGRTEETTMARYVHKKEITDSSTDLGGWGSDAACCF